MIENTHAEEPTAVSRGREVASLILAELGIQPEPDDNDYSYYRKAAEIKRIDGTVWDAVMDVIPLQREILKRLLNLLRMPDDVLMMADKYNVPERALREVLPLPEEMQLDMVLRIIEQGYTSEDVQIVRKNPKSAQSPAASRPKPAAYKAAGKVRSLYSFLLKEGIEGNTSEIATELAGKIKDDRELYVLADVLESLAAQLRLRFRD